MVAKSREGKRALIAYVEPSLAKKLKLQAVEEDTTSQALIVEAVYLLLEKYGIAPIGPRPNPHPRTWSGPA